MAIESCSRLTTTGHSLIAVHTEKPVADLEREAAWGGEQEQADRS